MTRVTALSRYRELVRLYHRPHEKSVPVGMKCSLLVRTTLNSLEFLYRGALSSNTVLRRLFNCLRPSRWYECTTTRREYPTTALDQQSFETPLESKRLAGLRPDSLDGFPLFI